MKMMTPELAAVIAGADASGARRGAQLDDRRACPRASRWPTASGVSPSMTISSTLPISGSSAVFDRALERRAIGVVGRCAHAPCTSSPTLEPDRTMPPGNGMITSGTAAMRLDRGFRRGSACFEPRAQNRSDCRRRPQPASGRSSPHRRTRRPSPECANNARPPDASKSANRRRNSAATRPISAAPPLPDPP